MEPLFPVDLSHLLYGICVNIFIMNRYISKSYTTSKNTIDRQHTERGQLQCQLLLVTTYYDVVRLFVLIMHLANGHFGKIFDFRQLKNPFLLSFARDPTATTQKEKSTPQIQLCPRTPLPPKTKFGTRRVDFHCSVIFLTYAHKKVRVSRSHVNVKS